MVSGVNVPGNTGYGYQKIPVSDQTVLEPEKKQVEQDTPETNPAAVFTGDVYTLLEHNEGTFRDKLGVTGSLDMGWGKITGQIEYAYPGLFPTDTASDDGFTVERINSTTYKVSGNGLDNVTIASAEDIEGLSLSDAQKKTVRSLFYKVYSSELTPAGDIKGSVMFSTLEDVLRFRLGILSMPRPEADAALTLLGIVQPDDNLGAELSLGGDTFRVGLSLMFSEVDPEDKYAIGLDNFKSSLHVGGQLDGIGLPNWTVNWATIIGKFPEPGNQLGQIIVYDQHRGTIDYDWKNFFRFVNKLDGSHLVLGLEGGLEDYKYEDTQKLLNTWSLGVKASGIIPLKQVKEKDETRTLWGFNFSTKIMYQHSEQFGQLMDDPAAIPAIEGNLGEVVAKSDVWNFQGSLGVTYSPVKDLTLGAYIGGSILSDDTSREQTDILNGGTYSVDEGYSLKNFFAGLYVKYSLNNLTKKKADK